jgi:hypothetical protein
VWKLAERHALEPTHEGSIAFTGGSDDHGALDIAPTFTEAPGETVGSVLAAIASGLGTPGGEHGSTAKLAHTVVALAANAYREGGGRVTGVLGERLAALFDEDAEDAAERHLQISEQTGRLMRVLGGQARAGGLELPVMASAGPRLSALAFAAALQGPYLATAHHHASSRADLAAIEASFFGIREQRAEPHAIVFTDTFDEANGVAGTMRRLAAEGAAGVLPLRVATSRADPSDEPGLTAFAADWTLPLPAYELLELRFPILAEVLARVEAERPDVIHVATPGPLGVCGLVSTKLLGIPLVGSYHTELGRYALLLTRDLLVAQALDLWVDWFYRQCTLVLAPTQAVANALEARGRWAVRRLGPGRRHRALHARAARQRCTRAPARGRRSPSPLGRTRLRGEAAGRPAGGISTGQGADQSVRLVIVGDGPAREALEDEAPPGVCFLGELHGGLLADVYAAADVFCFPSTTDTFGQVVLEAAASRLPVVAVAAGGALELVDDEQTGLVVPADDSEAFAAAVLQLASDPARRDRYGRAARAFACRQTWERSWAELRSAYRTVAETQSGEPRAVSQPPRAG